MRALALAAAVLLAATPAMAMNEGRHSGRGHGEHARGDRAHMDRGARADRGARTADADRAYAGGGLVLEGAPGAPAPAPRQTAPAGSLSPDQANVMPQSGMQNRGMPMQGGASMPMQGGAPMPMPMR